MPVTSREAANKGCPATSKNERPTYVIRLRPQPQVDAIRALRGALKILLRRFGLKAIEVKEEQQ
jgi:hypothetical protein